MFAPHKQPIVFILFLYCLITVLLPIARAQDEAVDEKIVERYKQMLERKPKEGSTFDRLYQLYLEGVGLDQMVIDYQTEVDDKTGQSKPTVDSRTHLQAAWEEYGSNLGVSACC